MYSAGTTRDRRLHRCSSVNPLDYKIRCIMHHRLYEIRVSDLDQLKQRLTEFRSGLQ